MKYLLFVPAILFVAISGNAQGIVLSAVGSGHNELYTPAANNINTVSSHCTVMKVGNRMMIAGAAVALAGGLGLASPWAKDHDPGFSNAGTTEAISVVVGGVSLAVVGAVLHIIGQEYEDKHPQHISVTTDKNKVGMAWNF